MTDTGIAPNVDMAMEMHWVWTQTFGEHIYWNDLEDDERACWIAVADRIIEKYIG
jgi:hypothetical protein